jgi:hypothetical protein
VRDGSWSGLSARAIAHRVRSYNNARASRLKLLLQKSQ